MCKFTWIWSLKSVGCGGRDAHTLLFSLSEVCRIDLALGGELWWLYSEEWCISWMGLEESCGGMGVSGVSIGVGAWRVVEKANVVWVVLLLVLAFTCE